MTAVAIESLRVDLTRLLLSARSSGPLPPEAADDRNAQTTTLFRRCKKKMAAVGVGHRNGDGGLGGDTGAATLAAAGSRKAPLPQEVGRYHYWRQIFSELEYFA